MKRRSAFILLFLAILLLVIPYANSFGQNRFNIGDGDWDDPARWSLGTVPIYSTLLYIGNSTPSGATASISDETGNASSADAYLGYAAGETGAVSLTDEKTWVLGNGVSNGWLTVGNYGQGELLIQDGSSVISYYGYIGREGNSDGEVLVTGTGALWETSVFTVGVSGSGVLRVEAGGKVTNSSTSYSSSVGSNAGSDGEVTITGEGSLWENLGSAVNVGLNGSGKLYIEDGGKVTAPIYFGYSTGSKGEGLVTGENSSLEGHVRVGEYGEGKLTVEDGGTVKSGSAYVGNHSGGLGEVLIKGSGARWENNTFFEVGIGGSGALTIENDGSLINGGNGSIGGYSFVTSSFGEGNVIVRGTGSEWSNSGTLNMRKGTLDIESGATVSNTTATVGNTSDAIAGVTVIGTGSQWINSSELYVGYNGKGSLTVGAGGKVSATYVMLAYSGSASQGTLNLNGTSGSRGVLETSYVQERNGSLGSKISIDGGTLRATATETNFLRNFESGDVEFKSGGAFIDTQQYNVHILTQLTGAGGLTKQGTGTLTLNGASIYTGDTTIEEGALIVNGSLTSEVTIKADATLGGAGSVGAVVIEDGGTISPGNSPGTLNTGTQTWQGGGTYVWEVNATSDSGLVGTNWDLVSINGNLVFAATELNPFYLDVVSLTSGSESGMLAGFDFTEDYSWRILTVSGLIQGFNADWVQVNTSGVLNDFGDGTFAVSQSGQSLFLNFTANAVPEPGRVLLLMCGLAGLLARRKRTAGFTLHGKGGRS